MVALQAASKINDNFPAPKATFLTSNYNHLCNYTTKMNLGWLTVASVWGNFAY